MVLTIPLVGGRGFESSAVALGFAEMRLSIQFKLVVASA